MTRTKRFLTTLAALSLASALAACSPPPPEGMLADFPELPADYTGPTCTGTHTGPPTEGVIFGPFEDKDPIPFTAMRNEDTEVIHDTRDDVHDHNTDTRRHSFIAEGVSVVYGLSAKGIPVIPKSPSDFLEVYKEQAGDLNSVRVQQGGEEEITHYALPPRYIDGNLALGYAVIRKHRVTGQRSERWLVWRCDGIWTVILLTPPLEQLPDGDLPPLLDSSKELLNTLKWVPKKRFDPPPSDFIIAR